MAPVAAQQIDQATVIQGIDNAVLARVNGIAGYTDFEHYAVYRGNDETHPVAAMTVKTTYRKEIGKSYDIVSQSGSAIIRKLGLDPILEREKEINLPGNVQHAWITSANYEMTLKPGGFNGSMGATALFSPSIPGTKPPTSSWETSGWTRKLHDRAA